MAIRNYLWLVLILLLMSIIVVPRLAWDGLWYDEVFSVMNSQGSPFGEPSLTSIWEQVSQRDPHQALGYPYLLAAWGKLIGWTEFSLRAFSLMAGLLAVAFTFQLGKRLVSENVGILSAMILAISSYFIHYSHELRSFTLVGAAAAAFVLAYHHLLKTDAKTALPLRYQALFVLSAELMLWSHYYAAMLIVGLGLYHLFFVKKDAKWLQIVGLAVLIALLFLPQAPSFILGYTRFETGDLAIPPLTTLEVLQHLLYFIGNEFSVLVGVSMLAAVWLAWQHAPKLRLLLAVTIFSTGILLLSNAILGILEPTRLRYAIFLFPLLAVWNGAGLATLAEKLRDVSRPLFGKTFKFAAPLLLSLLPLIWLGNGVLTNYQTDFNDSLKGDIVPRMRLMINAIVPESASSDLIAFYTGDNQSAWGMQRPMEYAFDGLLPQWIFASTLYDIDENNRNWASERIQTAQRIWYGVNRTQPLNEMHSQFLAMLEADFVECANFVDEWDIALDLYARTQAFCPTNETIMQFGDSFRLNAYESQVGDNRVSLNLGWTLAEDTPAEHYSLAVHLVAVGEVQPLVQDDLAFRREAFIPMSINLDTASLPAGRYEVWLTVYHWQTGERLITTEGLERWRILSFEK